MDESSRTAIVVDSHPLWALGIECVLRRVGVEAIGTATSGSEGLALVERLRPDLLVTDLDAREGENAGLMCLREARQRMPELRAIVLSLSKDPQDIEAALRAGATAYVLKSAHTDDLASTIRQAFAHSVYLPPALGVWRNSGEARPRADEVELTRRQREILRLVAEGHSNAQLAEMLWVTEQTIKFHLSNVYRKLRVSNRTEAARWAQLNGLIPTPDAITTA